MPDGTIVTTVTTVQSRPRVDGKLGKGEGPESPALTGALAGQEGAGKALTSPPTLLPHPTTPSQV